MNFTNKAPTWNAEGQEPTKDLQEQGFTAGYKPPAAYFNYMFNRYTKSINETQQKLGEVETQMQDSQLYPSKKANGAAIAINDSANLPFVDMSVYGKSTQDGTPTPDAPIDIVSVGEDGYIDIDMYRKNLLNISTIAKQSCTLIDSATGSVQLNITDDYFALMQTGSYNDFILKNQGIPLTFAVDDLKGYEISIVIYGTRTNGATYLDVGSETNNYATIYPTDFTSISKLELRIGRSKVAHTDTTTIYTGLRLFIGENDSEYENYNKQTLTLSTPNGLLGIPVTKGGNYTDENGQQWICDEIDLTRGVRIQRVKKIICDGSENWAASGTYPAYTLELSPQSATGLCTHLKKISVTQLNEGKQGIYLEWSGYAITQVKDTFETLEAFKTWLTQQYTNGNPFTIVYAFETPIETALTPAEIAAYKAITANKPNTTVINDSGAGMAVEYVTQAYDGALGMLEDKIKDVEENITPIQAGTEDLTAGTTALASGTIYCVYE